MNTVKTCNACGCKFLSLSWIPARVVGYCSDACAKPRLVMTDWKAVAIRGAIITRQANQQLDMLAMNRIEGEQ